MSSAYNTAPYGVWATSSPTPHAKQPAPIKTFKGWALGPRGSFLALLLGPVWPLFMGPEGIFIPYVLCLSIFPPLYHSPSSWLLLSLVSISVLLPSLALDLLLAIYSLGNTFYDILRPVPPSLVHSWPISSPASLPAMDNSQ